MTLFIFLSRSARTQIITARFLTFGWSDMKGGCCSGMILGLLAQSMIRILEKRINNLLIDGGKQMLKHAVRFFFVLNQRIALTIALQSNTCAQGTHRSQVIHPQCVNRTRDHGTLDGAQTIRVLKLLFDLCVMISYESKSGFDELCARFRSRGLQGRRGLIGVIRMTGARKTATFFQLS